jgi:hypothetical protein
MKRHPALQDLSRDHQLFLLNCRHIAWLISGDRRGKPFDETLRGFLAFWDDVGAHHVREEERVLFTHLAHSAAEIHTPQLRAEHARITAQIDALRSAPSAEALDAIGKALHDHVRFEERVVFEAAQAALDDARLGALWAASIAFREAARGPESVGARTGASCVVPKSGRARSPTRPR